MNYWQHLYAQSQQLTFVEQDIPVTQLNQHLDQPANVNTKQAQWTPSPAKGIVRILLERDGGEKTTRATSIVAYESDSHFAPHTHPLGEEFFVLAGVFSDENGDYPAGTYVRNPPNTSHQPFSKEGCLIFVKLQQFLVDDSQQITIDTHNIDGEIDSKGWSRKRLFDDYERVDLLTATKDIVLSNKDIKGGAELVILEGDLSDDNMIYQEGYWLRQPDSTSFSYHVKTGTSLLIKSGHLHEK